MTDPLSLIALGAAVGGATGKFVEKAWDSGERWIAAYLKDHRQTAILRAEVNSADFLKQLAERVSTLEKSGGVSVDTIDKAQDEPDFAVTLQRAILAAGQTDDAIKHDVLARVVSARLAGARDSTLSLASRLAVEAVAGINRRQLRTLAYLALATGIRPTDVTGNDAAVNWLEANFRLFEQDMIGSLDLTHLESLSCLRHLAFASRDLKALLINKGLTEDAVMAFLAQPAFSWVMARWASEKLGGVTLTSVGIVVGVTVHDHLTGSQTAFEEWD